MMLASRIPGYKAIKKKSFHPVIPLFLRLAISLVFLVHSVEVWPQAIQEKVGIMARLFANAFHHCFKRRVCTEESPSLPFNYYFGPEM